MNVYVDMEIEYSKCIPSILKLRIERHDCTKDFIKEYTQLEEICIILYRFHIPIDTMRMSIKMDLYYVLYLLEKVIDPKEILCIL